MNFYLMFKRNDFIVSYWRIFLFQSTSSSIVTLGFVETIRSMLESKPISISLLHLFQFIDIASQKLGPLLRNVLDLEFVIILAGPNLDLLWVGQSDAVPFCKNYANLYYDTKHLEERLNRGW